MPNQFEVNDKSLKNIEVILPRLRYSVSPTKIIKWLENFRASEVNTMLDLLRVFEYISYEEFLFRMDKLLSKILSSIPSTDEILLVPIEKFGKSGIFVTYPISKTEAFRERQIKNKIEISMDVKNIKFKDVKHIIFVDDFLGTGNTFNDWYDKQAELKRFIVDRNIYSLHILACVAMESAVSNIVEKFLISSIVADVRNKIFKSRESALQIYDKSVKSKIKSISSKYGKSFNLKFDGNLVEFGYGESQSLIAFFHSAPNNTLSIIWNDKNWIPLYARKSNYRLSEISELRKDLSYYINLCDRLKIDIRSTLLNFGKVQYYRSSDVDSKGNRFDHLLVLLIFLKNKGFDDIVISQILSLNIIDIKELYDIAKTRKLIDTSNNLTPESSNFIKNITKVTKKYNIKTGIKRKIEISRDVLYLPSMLNGTI